MGIAFGSINTGLPKDIVKQLVAAEQIPIQNMESKKSKIDEKKALVNELIGLVEKINDGLTKAQNAKSLREFTVNFNNELVDVFVDKHVAVPGEYQFEVEQLARKSSAMTSGFPERDSYVGVGYLQFIHPDGTEQDIYIDQENATLEGVAKLINKDTKNGLRATVVNDGTGSENAFRMIMHFEEFGDDAAMEYPYFYFVDGEQDFFVEFEREAQDAIVKLDGMRLESNSNHITDMLPGVTIDLKKHSPGEEFTIKIDEDLEQIAGKFNEIIDAINGVFRFIKTQNTMDENTDTSRTLGGDVVLQSLESRLRSTIFKYVETEFGSRRIGDIGIQFQKDGLLKLDQDRLKGALSKNIDMCEQIITGYYKQGEGKTKGFVDNVRDVVGMVLRTPNGLLKSRKQSLQSNIDQIDRQISNRQRMISQKEKFLKDKFARLEGTISRMKNQSAGLAGMGQAPNPVQQLG